jgi:DNA-binding response OmpR family regulator
MRVLVIEDNKEILTNLIDYLSNEHHTVDCAQDGLSGLHLATSKTFDIIVLDIMLPGMNGYQVCRKLREADVHTPIIMLTAKDALEDRLQGLDLGADDYLLKPFALSELLARMKSIVRRTEGVHKKILAIDTLTFDVETLHVRREGIPLKINPIGKKLLEVLMQKSPAIVKRETLESVLWGDSLPDSDSLRTHIHQLRHIVDKPFAKPLIHTIRGVGYCIAEHNEF